MKDKPSEWIAISDLMAGVMAVVMLLLVVSVVQKQEMERLAQAKDPSQQKLSKLLSELLTSLSSPWQGDGDVGYCCQKDNPA